MTSEAEKETLLKEAHAQGHPQVDARKERENQVAVHQGQQLAAPSTGNFLDVIQKAATDPNVDVQKMHGLLDVQERFMNKQAEINFNNALCDLQAELPRIKKSSKIEHNNKLISTYAKYEDIDDVIRPLLQKNGFSLRFNSKESNGKVIITGTLAHRDGHSITDEIPLAIDASGAKNNVQGVGSTIAYGKRYLVGMLLNLVFEGEDDDGNAAGHIPLSDEQASEIKTLLQETNSDVKQFLEWIGAKNVDAMSASAYPKAKAALERKKKQAEGGENVEG